MVAACAEHVQCKWTPRGCKPLDELIHGRVRAIGWCDVQLESRDKTFESLARSNRAGNQGDGDGGWTPSTGLTVTRRTTLTLGYLVGLNRIGGLRLLRDSLKTSPTGCPTQKTNAVLRPNFESTALLNVEAEPCTRGP